MFVGSMKLKLYLPWTRSLKDKRMEVKSLTSRLRNRLGVAVAEVDAQDLHQTAVIGVACVAQTAAQCEQLLERAAGWVQANTEAEMTVEERQVL